MCESLVDKLSPRRDNGAEQETMATDGRPLSKAHFRDVLEVKQYQLDQKLLQLHQMKKALPLTVPDSVNDFLCKAIEQL